MTKPKQPKYRPYLTIEELQLISSLLTDHNKLLLSPAKSVIVSCALRSIGKTILNANAGMGISYIPSENPKKSLTEQLDITNELSGNLSDEEKLKQMTKAQQLQHWIDFNQDQFGIAPTKEQLKELEDAISEEITTYEDS